MVEDSKLIRGCGVDLRTVDSASYGDYKAYYGGKVKYWPAGWWDNPYPCGCSVFDNRDNWPPENRTEWILCDDCAVKYGFKW